MRENVYPEQIDRFLESWVALAQQSSSTGNYRVEREGSNRRFVPGDKKTSSRKTERSFSMTSNSSEDPWKAFVIEIAVAFLASTPLLLSLSLSFATYVFLWKFMSRPKGIIDVTCVTVIINQSREFVMKNVKRSFITELEERESDEIGLARTPVPL